MPVWERVKGGSNRPTSLQMGFDMLQYRMKRISIIKAIIHIRPGVESGETSRFKPPSPESDIGTV